MGSRILITFGSTRWDIASEPPNDINPIHGQSFLAWLRPALQQAGYDADDPSTEDWGWYIDVRSASATYLIGATAQPDGASVSWLVQILRQRSLREHLTGKGKIAPDDALVRLVERLIREHAGDGDISVGLQP